MLLEIYVPEFASYKGRDQHIRFGPGLNIIQGTKDAANSIGKSTTLLIIDFAFGGEDFAKSKTVEPFAVSDHTIYFTFQFADREYYFSRDTSRPGYVQVYADKHYRTREDEWSLNEFRKFLKDEYKLTDPDLSWRGAFGRFSRVHEKDDIAYSKPLKVGDSRAVADIEALEKLFGVYQPIKELQDRNDKAQERLTTLKAAARLGLSDYITLRTKTNYKKAQTRLKEAETELENLRAGADQRLFDEDMAGAEEKARLSAQLNSLITDRKTTGAKLAVIEASRIGTPQIDTEDISQLQAFFPEANIVSLREIEGFHYRLAGILERELDEQEIRYQKLADMLDQQINLVRAQMASINVSSNLNDAELDRAGTLKAEIQRLRAQADAWEATEDAKDEAKEAADELARRRPELLQEMTSSLNKRLEELNDRIYDGAQYPPIFELKETSNGGQRYTYGTPRDTGDGTTAKNLIVFDLAIASLTALPAIIHDSPIIKNIGDQPVEEIMKLYVEAAALGVQIFVAFDKAVSYTPGTRDIVQEHTVIEVGEGEAALYGRVWNTKDKRNDQ